MKSAIFGFLLIVFLAGCASPSPVVTGTISNDTLSETAATLLTSAPSQPVNLATTLTPTPAATSTPPPTATPPPLPSPTPAPAVFDREGYQQFAILRNFFPGFEDYAAGRSPSTISVSLSPDGNLLAISGCWGSTSNLMTCEYTSSGFLVVMDTSTGEYVTEIPLEKGWPGKTAFTADGKSLVYGTHEIKVALWDLTNNKPAITLIERDGSRSTRYPYIAAAPDGNSIAAVIDTTLYVWSPSGSILLQAPAYKTRTYTTLAYSADGERLITVNADKSGVDIYSTSDWSLVRQMKIPTLYAAAISPEGDWLAALASSENSVKVWDVDSGNLLAELDAGHPLHSITFNPKGDLLIASGMGSLDTPDDYELIGTLIETTNWTILDALYSYSYDGVVSFSQDGSRMAVTNYGQDSIWGLPDNQLQAGYEVVKQFQSALAVGDYDTAASLFFADERDASYLAEIGIDLNDLPGSFEALCADGTIFCRPVQGLVRMGYDWDDMTYLVRLAEEDGSIFTSPKGAQIVYIYLRLDADGKPRVTYPAME